MNGKQVLPVLLLTAALLLSACNRTQPNPSADSDTQTQTPAITENVPTPPVIPADGTEPQTEEQTEPPVTEPIEIPVVDTEPTPEQTEPLPELPIEIPAEDTAAPTEETTSPAETEAPAPIVIVKPTIDLAGKLVPGGDAVHGQVKSPQSDHICLLLDYTAEQAEDGTVTLTLDVGLSCYELWCSAKTDMGTITVNGVSRTFSTDAIDHMVHEKTYIPFLTQTYNATGNQSASIEVSWYFNGTYGGTEIGVLSTGLILLFDPENTTAPTLPEPPVTEPPVTTEPVAEESIPAEPTPVPEPDAPSAETEPVPETEQPVPTEPTDPAVPTEPTEPVQPVDPNVPADTASQPTDGENPVTEVSPPPPEEAGTP